MVVPFGRRAAVHRRSSVRATPATRSHRFDFPTRGATVPAAGPEVGPRAEAGMHGSGVATTTDGRTAAPPGAVRTTPVLLVVSAATFLASLDLFIVNIAFPAMTRDFGASAGG